MGLNRKLADLAQFIDSSSSGESITKSATGVGTKAVVSSDVQGSAGTFTFTDSSYIANVISASYITSKTGKATSLTGTKSMFQGSMPDLIPQTTATYDLGDSAKPLAELILDSSANLFFGSEAFTSILSSGTANNVGGPAAPSFDWGGDRGFVVAGLTAGNAIDYYNITTPGNATNFGSIRAGSSHQRGASASNGTRGVFNMGSSNITGGGLQIEYITCATTGNSTSFGDMTVNRYDAAGHGDGTYGVYGGGKSNTNVIDYVTIASTGNASDFGDLYQYGSYAARGEMAGAGDATRTIFGGGSDDGYNKTDHIQYITTATPGNAADFGDLAAATEGPEAASDATYTLFFGGNHGGSRRNDIQYITTQTPGNTTDFGDLTEGNAWGSASSNGTYAVNGFGYTNSFSNVMNYVTIATPGNAQDFGDLVQTAEYTFQGFSGNAA